MNIVFVSKECPPSPRSSGIGAYVWETGRALARVGHQVTIIAASDDGQATSSVASPGLAVIRLPDDESGVEDRRRVTRVLCPPLGPGIAYRRRVAECIGTLTDNHRADVVEFPGYRGESAVWLAGQRLLPMAVRFHGFTAGIDAAWRARVSATGRLQLNWEREELDAADIITVVSENKLRAVRARFGPDRVRVVHNSIDSDRWRKLSGDASRGIGPNDVLFVGTLARTKGIFTLLRAAKLLRKTGWRGRLLLAGPASREFRRFVRVRAALGVKLPDWVTRLGTCQRERLAGLYRAAGACCFPSLVDSFPYTCLEAMACGGLVVGSLGTGMAEMLTEACGFLVPPRDVRRLAAGVRSALSMSSEDRSRMKEAARASVRDRFDHRVIVPRLLAVYNETIDSHRAGR